MQTDLQFLPPCTPWNTAHRSFPHLCLLSHTWSPWSKITAKISHSNSLKFSICLLLQSYLICMMLKNVTVYSQLALQFHLPPIFPPQTIFMPKWLVPKYTLYFSISMVLLMKIIWPRTYMFWWKEHRLT